MTRARVTLAFTAVSRVQFHAGAGFTVPTQIVFVPMLFVVPPVWAPVLAGAAMTLGRVPAVLSGGQHITASWPAPVTRGSRWAPRSSSCWPTPDPRTSATGRST